MLSKIDLCDFIEINRGLYGDDASTTALCDMLRRMIAVLELEQNRRHSVARHRGEGLVTVGAPVATH